MIGFEEFINAIEPTKRESARNRFKELKDNVENRIREAMRLDQESRRFVNLCIYPFSMKGRLSSTGYRFYCVDPLQYLNDTIDDLKNFDVLHYNDSDGSSIFIECRGGTNFSPDWYKEIEGKISVVQKFIQNELGMDFNKSEFVLMINSIIKDKAIEELKKTQLKDKIIIWSVDFWKGIIQLSYGKHSNGKLVELLSDSGVKCPDFNNIISIMPSSHMGNKLELVSAMLEIKLKDSQKDRFTVSDLCEVLKKEFHNYPEVAIEKIASSILEEGLKSEIFNPLGDTPPLNNFFGMKIRKMGTAGEESKEKYIRKQAEEKALTELYQNYSDVIESVQKKSKEQTNLKDIISK